jgi:ABC-type glutathione transport system ATPase component
MDTSFLHFPDHPTGRSSETAPLVLSLSTYGGAAVRIRGLRKDFGGVEVLRGIDLDIPAGQFAATVGRSGCGKSTLLRILTGLGNRAAARLHCAVPTTRGPCRRAPCG